MNNGIHRVYENGMLLKKRHKVLVLKENIKYSELVAQTTVVAAKMLEKLPQTCGHLISYVILICSRYYTIF